MIKKVAWFLFFALLAGACLDSPDCYDLNNNVIGISFRKMYDNKADTVSFYSVTVDGATSTIEEYVSATGVSVPVNYLEDESIINFDILNPDMSSFTTSMTLSYTSQAQFVSEDCGERYIVSDLKITEEPDFDSIRLVSTTPVSTNSSGTNIIVYRCPRLNFMRVSFYSLTVAEDTGEVAREIKQIQAEYSGTLFYQQDTATQVRLPLSLSATTSTFDFTFNDGTENTLTVNYGVGEKQVLSKCGTQQYAYDLNITGTDFDNYVLTEDSIQDPPMTNISVYTCAITNLMEIDFVDEDGDEAYEEVLKVTASHMNDLVDYPDSVSTIVVPLDESSDASEFVIEFADGSKTLAVSYTREQETTFEGLCTATYFSDIAVTSSDFTTEPDVVETDIEYPTDTNIEIVND